MSFWTYMLHCADSTLYVGHTDDLEKRVGEHEQGALPGYTRERRPIKLVWSQQFGTRQEAREAETRLKGWGRLKKQALIRGDWKAISELARGKKEGRASTGSAKPVLEGLLHPHYDQLPSEPFNLETIVRVEENRLSFRYRLTGPLVITRIPALSEAIRRNELWKHTCFEAFLTLESGRYLEFNFSPSTEWAAYKFTSYRAGMTDLTIAPPQIRIAASKFALEMEAIVHSPVDLRVNRLGLAAILEENTGRKSYWALRHPPGPPDFHHPDCFALELPPSSSP